MERELRRGRAPTTTTWSCLAVLPLLLPGCHFKLEGTFDPYRCDPKCPGGKVCHQGECITTDAGEKDGAPLDAGPPPDAKPQVDTGPPQYSVQLGLLEYTGKESPTGPTVTMGRYLAVVSRLSPPDPLNAPDFIGAPSPPNCTAYKWTATQPKKGNAWDAGKLTITGHKTGANVVYIDGADMGAGCAPACTPPQYCKVNGTCGVPPALPATFEFTRQLVPGTTNRYEYRGNLPAWFVLPGDSWFDTATTLDISAAGGADVSAFSKTGVTVASAPTLKSTTDLTALDPAAITIEWNTPVPGAALVAAGIQAYLADHSETVEITCTSLAVTGSTDVEAGALALIPTPSATNPLVIQTVVLGLSAVGSSSETWGEWLVGAGRGVFGQTCRSASGVVPCP
jgi:hypothetical protein